MNVRVTESLEITLPLIFALEFFVVLAAYERQNPRIKENSIGK
jgi:hypothetical protein